MGRHVGVPVERGGHDDGPGGHGLEEDDAERLAVQRRRAEHVGAPHAGRHVVVAEPAEPLDAGVPAVPGAQRLGLRAGAPDPHHDVGREVAQRVEQHGQALALLVAAHEQDRGPARRGRGGLGEPLDLDAVEQQLVASAEGPLGRDPGVLRHRAADVEPLGQPPDARLQHGVGRAVARPVERAHQRRVAEQQGCHGRPRRQRLVHVEDVERLVAQGPDRAELGRGIGGQRGERPVRRGGHALAERRHAGVGRRAVARGEHPGVDTQHAQRAGEAQHLRLDTARDREAVGADEPDAHGVRVLPGREPPRSRRRTPTSGPRPSRPDRSASSAASGATARAPAGSGSRARRPAPG